MNMRKILMAGLAMSGLMMAQAGDTPDYKAFAKRLTVTPSESLVSGTATYENVPVLLRLSESIQGFSYDDFKQDGRDMLIFDESGAMLPYEIETWNAEGDSFVWVKVPELSADTRLTAYYGSEDVTPEVDAKQVWSDYAGVWHFDEATDGGSCKDSSPNGYDTQNKDANKTEAAGVIGAARNMVEGGISVPNSTKMDLGGSFTVEGWVKRNSLTGNWDHFFYKKNASGDWGGWCMELYAEGSRYGTMSILGRDGRKGNNENVAHGIDVADTWYHIVVAYNGTSATLYNNGVKKGTSTFVYESTWTGQNIRDLTFGMNGKGEGAMWQGCFDEFRIRAGAFDDARANVEYQTMSAGALNYAVSDNVKTMPVLTTPVVTRNPDGTYSVSVGLTEGVATSVKVVLNGVAGQELAPSGATEGWSTTEKLTGLSADAAYALKVMAVNDDGFVAYSAWDGTFYTGVISVSNGGDAREEKLVEGAFVLSRPDTDAARAVPLQVFYSVSGTAVAGADYETLSGTATIPAGEASVRVPVRPLSNIWKDEDVKVTVKMEGGNYTPSDTPASVTVFNCRNAALASFTRRTVISFPGYDRDETLEGFPVLVRLSEANGNFHYADIKRADHGDLAFYDSTGAHLPHEIDTWDETGESLVWVRVRELSRGSEIMMFYGSVNAADNDPQDVWSDYVGVWHLNETGEGAGVAIADSSVHALHGTTPTNAEKIDPDGNKGTDGRIGGARKISTKGGLAELGRILVKNNDNKDLYTGRKVSVSIWCRYATSENWGYLIDRKARDDWDTWGIQFNGSSNVNAFRLYTANGASDSRSFGSVLSKDTWHHVFAVWNEGEQRLYVDGDLKTTNTGCNWIQDQQNQNLAIGGLVNDSGEGATWGVFPGDLDEARVSGAVRDTAWALTEYATVADASFSVIGATEVLSGTKPAVDYATYDADAKAVSLPLLAGSGDVYAIIRLPNGSVQTNLAASGVVAPKTTTLPLSSLPKIGWIDVRMLAVQSETGAYDERDWSVRAYNHPKPSCIKLAVNGYDGEEVENFPALVRISQGTGGFDPSVLFDRETGSDVWFTDEGGNVLPCECEAWDPDGESVYWVRMPKLAAEAKIFANYGSDTAPERSAATRAAVWSDQNCVWHAEFLQVTDGYYYLNSARENMNDARGWDNSTTPVAGVVCNGRMISDGGKGDKWGRGLQFSNHELFRCGGNFTVSLWIRYKKGQDVGYDRIIAIKENYNTSNGWEISLVQDKPYDLQIRGASETAAGTLSFNKPINDGEWHYLTVVYAGTTAKVYENGVYRTSGEITAADDPNVSLVIGNNSKRAEVDLKGTVDEIRLGAGELSAARIKADYLTVSDKSFFTATPYKPGLIVIIK